MVDEFQDTNPLQLDLLELLERDNLFAVGDEFQSIYRFRHADVGVFRERRERARGGRARGQRANFRSRPELLDALNARFARVFGTLRAARARPGGRAGAASATRARVRLFDPDPLL